MKDKVTMLMILDGFGDNKNKEGNAIKLANTPNIDKLMKKYPTTDIFTSGLQVGLPEGQMGNSEVGHTNIGAGRIVYQELTRITKSIEDGDFFSIPELADAIENVKKNNSKLHIMGLLSDGGVHSHERHLYALLELAKRKGLDNNVFVHCFMDGRDTPPTSGEGYVSKLEEKMKEKGVGKIATISGRFYAMDRDKRWERVSKAYNALVRGKGLTTTSAIQAVENSYQKEVFDEFIEPTIITNNDAPIATIGKHDSVIFFNFRPDRAREITRTLVDKEFNGFDTEKDLELYYVCMTPYDETMPNVHIAFEKEPLINTFGEYISKKGLTQLRIAETEKYAHVTFFFNGGEEKEFKGEERILIASPKVATYDLKPEMSVYEVTEQLVKAIEDKRFDVIICNYANGDMVGHTGIMTAALQAVAAVDECLGKVEKAIKKVGGVMIVTADHGNAEKMVDEKTGQPYTAHTVGKVAAILVNDESGVKRLKDGAL